MAQTTLPAASAGVQPVPHHAPLPDDRPGSGRPRIPGLWSRALFAVLRPAVRGRPRARCLTLLVTQLVAFPERRPLHELARMLTAHDRLLLPLIRAHRGRRVSSRGSAVLATFASPTDAVLCGIAIQDLAARNAGAPEHERFSIRLAVHLGETRFRRGRLVGAPVDRAREVCGAATDGEVWLTSSVQLAMNHAEVTVEPLTAAAGAGAERVPVYRARRSPGEVAGASEAALASLRPGRLERALEPISDAIASIEEGAAEGRARATFRVACAAAALAALGFAGLLVRCALAGSALAALGARCVGGVSPRVDRLSRRISAALPWIRSRSAIPRAALIRPLW